MQNTRALQSDGTVEISDLVYGCLMSALRTIAAGNDACCAERGRGKRSHTSFCPVGIAQAALREADRLSSLPNSILDGYDLE